MKYKPAALFALLAVFFFIASRAGDNTDAQALAGTMLLPAAFFAVMAISAAGIAYLL